MFKGNNLRDRPTTRMGLCDCLQVASRRALRVEAADSKKVLMMGGCMPGIIRVCNARKLGKMCSHTLGSMSHASEIYKTRTQCTSYTHA